MSISVTGSRTAFGTYLRELRKRKGVESPADLSHRMRGAVSVSGILKRERGELKITQDYVEAFLKAVRVTAEEERHLRQHLSLFLLQFDLWRSEKSLLDINIEASERLTKSNDIRCFSPTIIPHVLQTPAYAHAILETYRFCESDSELKKTIRVREQSATRIREEYHRTVRLVSSESALYAIYGGPDVMLEQLTRLLQITDDSHVHYRIVPFLTHSNLPADSTFTIHDGLFVTAESTIGNLYTGDKDKTAWVASHFERLWSAAVSHQERRKIIEKAIRFLRSAKK
ncbi:MAG TPA: helix-turn-helix transcriptional regulator [Terriglobales bacterium]|nr:helix-turn-helix transcriptional regulator [Terriglobales bacterium]